MRAVDPPASAGGVNRSQRFAMMGVFAVVLGVVVGWALLGLHLRLDASEVGRTLTIVYMVGMLLLANITFFGHLTAFRQPRALAPIRIPRPRYRVGVTVFIALFLISGALAFVAFARLQFPESLRGVGGTAAHLSDGRFALVNHGEVLRYISSAEYERVITGERLGMTTLALLAGLVYAGATAYRLWIPAGGERPPGSIRVTVYALGLGVVAAYVPAFLRARGATSPPTSLPPVIAPDASAIAITAGMFFLCGVVLTLLSPSRSWMVAAVTCLPLAVLLVIQAAIGMRPVTTAGRDVTLALSFALPAVLGAVVARAWTGRWP